MKEEAGWPGGVYSRETLNANSLPPIKPLALNSLLLSLRLSLSFGRNKERPPESGKKKKRQKKGELWATKKIRSQILIFVLTGFADRKWRNSPSLFCSAFFFFSSFFPSDLSFFPLSFLVDCSLVWGTDAERFSHSVSFSSLICGICLLAEKVEVKTMKWSYGRSVFIFYFQKLECTKCLCPLWVEQMFSIFFLGLKAEICFQNVKF